MSPIPPLRKLEYVLAVARELHFGKAAERVHVVQSSISRQVREVEDELGFAIFRRSNHVVDFTDEGRPFTLAMADIVAKFYEDFKRARDISRLISRRNARTCLIGYSPFVPATLRHEIRSIRTLRFPSVHLEFRLASASEMLDSLGSGVFQVGVTYAPVERNDMQQIQLCTEPLYAISTRAKSASAGGAIKLVDLRLQPLIVACSDRTHPAMYRWLHEQCAIAGFKPKIAEEATSPQEAFDLVQDGVGIAIVPHGICDEIPTALQCSPIHGIEPLRLVLVYWRGASKMAQKIAREIAESLQRTNSERAG